MKMEKQKSMARKKVDTIVLNKIVLVKSAVRNNF